MILDLKKEEIIKNIKIPFISEWDFAFIYSVKIHNTKLLIKETLIALN